MLGRKYSAASLACILSLLALPAQTVLAAQDVAQIPFSNTPNGTAALGAGLRMGRSLYRAVDNEDTRQLDLIPLYLYNGKYVFAQGTSGGLHIFNNGKFEFNLLAQFRFQKLDPDRNAFYEGLEERDQTVDAGLELVYTGKYGEISADFLTDTLNKHQGQSASASYRYDFDRGRFTFSPFISWSWNDAKLTNYYYGVSAAEARPDRPEYAPGESNWVSFGLNSSWWINDRINFFANLGFGSVDTTVSNSPLVAEDSASAGFIGGTYLFGNARHPELYISEERVSEWSWRVNYGYQADGNIVSEIDQGDFSKSTFADTNIAGFTLGKLLTDGPRVDFVGRVSVYRHLEEDEGNGNFFSYAAYMMAMGKGYSAWSGEEWFRWGFGFGMSYADKVPIVEQRKQASKGENTARFLNYLEMQLDFPLRRLFKSKAMENCYAGLTIVHRSGIFGSSDFLGDVAGGADWLTAHFECMGGRR